MGFDVMYERVQQELAETRIALAAMTARVEAAEAKLEAVEALPSLWDSQQLAYPAEGNVAAAAVRCCSEELTKALAITGPSVRQRVEKVLAQWRGQKWIYTRGEVIRRTCIEEIEGALKGEEPDPR